MPRIAGLLTPVFLVLVMSAIITRQEEEEKDAVSLLFHAKLLTEGELRNIHEELGMIRNFDELKAGDKFSSYMNERIEHVQNNYKILSKRAERTFISGLVVLALGQVSGQYRANDVVAPIEAKYKQLDKDACEDLNERFHFDSVLGECPGK